MSVSTSFNERSFGLDLFRAVAIILVVHSHGAFMLKGTFLEGFPWIPMIDGVELFFVLSGFLIGTILIRQIDQDDYHFRVKDALHFWKRRWFRTLPNYYLILLVNYLLVSYEIIDGDLHQFNLGFLFFLQNFSRPFVDFFWESWSLSVEEWFYIILPIVLLFVLHFFRSRRTVLAVIIALLVGPFLYRVACSGQQVDGFWWDATFRKVVLLRLDAIMYGVFAAYIKYFYNNIWKAMPRVFFLVGAVIIYLSLSFHNEPNSFYSKVLLFNGTAIGSMLLLPLADSLKNYKGRLARSVTHISLISYSAYLVNLALGAQVISKNFMVQNPLDGFFKYFAYWAYVILLSTILYYWFEKPMTNLRERKFKKDFFRLALKPVFSLIKR